MQGPREVLLGLCTLFCCMCMYVRTQCPNPTRSGRERERERERERMGGSNIQYIHTDVQIYTYNIVDHSSSMGYNLMFQIGTLGDGIMALEVRDRIVQALSQASQSLLDARDMGVKHHEAFIEVPVFQRMEKVAKEVMGMMQEVAKLRGLS